MFALEITPWKSQQYHLQSIHQFHSITQRGDLDFLRSRNSCWTMIHPQVHISGCRQISMHLGSNEIKMLKPLIASSYFWTWFLIGRRFWSDFAGTKLANCCKLSESLITNCVYNANFGPVPISRSRTDRSQWETILHAKRPFSLKKNLPSNWKKTDPGCFNLWWHGYDVGHVKLLHISHL